MMPFQIMTDQEMPLGYARAATSRLTEIRDILQKCHGILATLLMIATDSPKYDHIDRRPRPRKTTKTRRKVKRAR